MDKNENNQNLEQIFEEHLRRQYRQGLATGGKAIAAEILKKVNNTKIPPVKRLKEIEVFCKKGLGLYKKEAAKK